MSESCWVCLLIFIWIVYYLALWKQNDRNTGGLLTVNNAMFTLRNNIDCDVLSCVYTQWLCSSQSSWLLRLEVQFHQIHSSAPHAHHTLARCSPTSRSSWTRFISHHIYQLYIHVSSLLMMWDWLKDPYKRCADEWMLTWFCVWPQEGQAKHPHLFAGFNCTEQTTQMIPFTQTAVVCQPITPAVSLFICLTLPHVWLSVCCRVLKIIWVNCKVI